jgi:Spy/CpxP family protein refolding chaperone
MQGTMPAERAQEMVARYLELTPEQLEQWNQLLATLRQRVEPLRQQLVEAEGALQELLAQANPDPAAVGTLVLHIKQLRDAIAQAQETYVQAFEALLTPEQLARLRLVRGAQRVMPLIPAFQALRLLP